MATEQKTTTTRTVHPDDQTRTRIVLRDGTEIYGWHASYGAAKESVQMIQAMSAGRGPFRSLSVQLDTRATGKQVLATLDTRTANGRTRMTLTAELMDHIEIVEPGARRQRGHQLHQ